MKISHSVLRRLHCLHLPGALLIALLQRTPAVRLLASAGESALRQPTGAWLKSAAATLGALGAVHTLAGATTLSPSTPSPAALAVGTAKTIAFAVIGAQSAGESWTVGGSVPPGMTFNGGATSGTINTPNGILTLSGTPTTAGTYVLSLRAWEKAGAKGASSPLYSYTINVTGGTAATAPAFTSHPASQTVTAGASVTFSVAATGSPTPTLQWQKNGAAIAGQTGPTLTLNGVTSGDAASYTCVASNTAGSATSNAATLTVNAAAAAPAFTTQPASQTVTVGASVTFTVAASGSPAPTLQWHKDGAPLPGQTGSSLALPNVQAGDAGAYTCVATNSVSAVTSNPATLTVNATPAPTSAPVFTVQPASVTVAAGGTLNLSVTVSGTPTPTLQWFRNGSALAGRTGPTLTVSNVQPGDAGTYTCVASNAVAAVTSSAASVGVGAEPAPGGRISNVSVRTTLGAAQTLIVGFTMQGGAKPVVVRAVGPGLANFGVAGAMPDPRLLLYKEAAMLTQNDNWGGAGPLTNAFAAVGAFPLPAASLDAALMRTVEGGHTAQVSGPAGGNVLVEAYDAGTGGSPRLSNISARNFVGTGGDILIAGFTIAGSGPKNLLIRAVGPTLGAFGVLGTLADPKVAVYNAAGAVVAENDSWSASLAGVFASVGAFPLAAGSKDAAFTLALPPGGYTVQVSGADGGTGEALVEVYELP